MAHFNIQMTNGKEMQFEADFFTLWGGELHVLNGDKEKLKDAQMVFIAAPGQWAYIWDVSSQWADFKDATR